MKLQGKTFDGPNEELLVLIRNGQPIAFKARAVLTYEEFDALCPRPKPKVVTLPSGEKKLVTDDKSYQTLLDQWATRRTAWTVIQSLKATPGIEWERVKYEDPNTWTEYEKELREAFFSESEIAKIINTVWAANSVDEVRLKEARERFLAGPEAESNEP